MKYIIEERVYFRPDDGTLWLIDRETEKIILPPIVSRLMTVLLEEQGKVLTREELMHRVWTIHGLEPSGNSLNQYISNIRRNMQNLGLSDDVIRTVPRIGFILNNEILIEKEREDALVGNNPGDPDVAEPGATDAEAADATGSDITKSEMPEPGATGSAAHNHQAVTEPKNTAINHQRKFFISLLCFVAFLIAVPFIIKNTLEFINGRQQVNSPVLIGRINSCDVYGINMERSVHEPGILELSQKLFNENKITCQPDNVALLFIQNGVFHDKPGRIFISVCTRNKEKLTSCKNNLFNSWL